MTIRTTLLLLALALLGAAPAARADDTPQASSDTARPERPARPQKKGWYDADVFQDKLGLSKEQHDQVKAAIGEFRDALKKMHDATSKDEKHQIFEAARKDLDDKIEGILDSDDQKTKFHDWLAENFPPRHKKDGGDSGEKGDGDGSGKKASGDDDGVQKKTGDDGADTGHRRGQHGKKKKPSDDGSDS